MTECKKNNYFWGAMDTGLHATKLLAEKFGNSANLVGLWNFLFFGIFSFRRWETELKKKKI
jgi:hypothetical protein